MMRSESNFKVLQASLVAIFAVGAAVAYAGPLLDPELRLPGSPARLVTNASLRGEAIYEGEGCWYCHTQQVRPVSNDIGLGLVTEANRSGRDSPSLLGMARLGPDLGCYGDRAPSEGLADYLSDPRAARPYSKMPGYRYLSDAELKDLSAYLVGLSCTGAAS